MRCHATKPDTYIDELNLSIGQTEMKKLLVKFAPANVRNQYEVSSEHEGEHEYGHGGYGEQAVRLLKGDQLLVLSISYTSWDTTSDDFVDYTHLRKDMTYLLGQDPVAQKIFDSLRPNP